LADAATDHAGGKLYSSHYTIGIMTRQESLDLLHEYTKSDSLRKHALAVEAAMRAYADRFGENEETWGITGLLHDFDYEMHPTVPHHPMQGSEILKQRGYPEEIRQAILGHVPAMNVPRETRMAKTLFACDELCGFIIACAMVRPNKIADLEASSVKKKMKDKAFARGVNRDEIRQGVEELGIPLDEHITFLITALKEISDDLGI
jgi:putative nucleotidyltransferase with HDIG domain